MMNILKRIFSKQKELKQLRQDNSTFDTAINLLAKSEHYLVIGIRKDNSYGYATSNALLMPMFKDLLKEINKGSTQNDSD